MKMKTINILLLCLIGFTPLIILVLEKHDCQNCSSFWFEYGATGYLETPTINDLYLLTDTLTGATSYFKISGANKAKNSFILLNGKELVEDFSARTELIKINENNKKIKGLIQSNIGYLDSITFISKDSLIAKVIGTKQKFIIYRMPEQRPLDWWYFYNTPVGQFSYFLFALLIIAFINFIVKLHIPKFYIKNYEWLIYLAVVVTIFRFYNHIWLYNFNALVVLSIIPITFCFHRLNKYFFQQQKFVDREIQKFALLYIGGFVLQILALTIVVRYFFKMPGAGAGFKFFQYFLSQTDYSEDIGFPPLFRTFLLGWLILAIGNFLNNLIKHIIQLRQKEKELITSKQKELQSQAELDALQAKVNPHFLYNSLNSIAGLAQEDSAKTEEMAIALSHFFKYSTNRQTENWSTIEKEIEILETYLEIEKIRFGDRLQFQLTCPDELLTIKTPRFLLQPIVENAIKCGYDQTTNSIAIQLEISQNGNQLVFQIYDGGKPFPDNMPSGYGLQSIRKKLALLYPAKHELAFINVPKKHVKITLFS